MFRLIPRKVKFICGCGGLQNPTILSWAWCAIECSRRSRRQCHCTTLFLSTSHHLRAKSLQLTKIHPFRILRCSCSCCCTVNKLDTSTNGNYTIHINPWAPGSLNHIVPLSRCLAIMYIDVITLTK